MRTLPSLKLGIAGIEVCGALMFLECALLHGGRVILTFTVMFSNC